VLGLESWVAYVVAAVVALAIYLGRE